MAEHLASTFGREEDRANCFFYFKVGACRDGDRCRDLHTRPSISRTLLVADMYQRQEHFEDFYEDWYERLSEYGEIECLNICDNAVQHLKGNVYVQFREERHAADALRNLTGRLYNGRRIRIHFSPVTDFHQARCRQYANNNCIREDHCNFLHLKKISRDLRMRLLDKYHRKHRSHEDRPHVGPSYGRHNDDKDRYHEEQGTRHRSRSPGFKRGRSRSARGTRNRSPEKEGHGKEIRRTRERGR